MKDDQFFARVLSIVPIVWLFSFLLALSIGTMYLGHLPFYGLDQDPYSISSIVLTTTTYIVTFCELLGYFIVPVWIFFLIQVLLAKLSLTKRDILIYVIGILGLFMFLLFRFVWTSQFDWVYD